MLLDAVLTDREVVWLATERDKWRHFVNHLRGQLREEDYPRLVFGKGDKQTVRHFPDKLPIGVDTKNGRPHLRIPRCRPHADGLPPVSVAARRSC